jgi:hypothetical protein
MTLIPLTDCCRMLAIDGKTLRRWLAQAELSVHAHPGDARCKGLSREHLRQLATLHHRWLPALPEEEPALPPADVAAAWPTELLALPARLASLQTQLTALQQQMSDLTHLVQQLAEPPALAAQAVAMAPAGKRPRQPTSAASRSRSVASASTTPQSSPAHVIPLVEASHDGHYVVICPKQGLLPFEPDTPQWFTWLAKQSSFRFVGKGGRLTAHHEWRVPRGAWRAHRQIRNHSYTLRLAPTHELTIAVLEQAAQSLQAHLS